MICQLVPRPFNRADLKVDREQYKDNFIHRGRYLHKKALLLTPRSRSPLSHMKKQRSMSEVSKLCFEMTNIHIHHSYSEKTYSLFTLLSAITFLSAMVSFFIACD